MCIFLQFLNCHTIHFSRLIEHTMVSSQYLQIALDLASRIAKEEFSEGSKIYGRSVMASAYNVSPETIRRALKLLHDMKVVEIKPQSGATVLSKLC